MHYSTAYHRTPFRQSGFWTPNLDQLLGLATMYGENPEFKANFDQMHPQLAEFMRDAVKIYVENRKK